MDDATTASWRQDGRTSTTAASRWHDNGIVMAGLARRQRQDGTKAYGWHDDSVKMGRKRTDGTTTTSWRKKRNSSHNKRNNQSHKDWRSGWQPENGVGAFTEKSVGFVGFQDVRDPFSSKTKQPQTWQTSNTASSTNNYRSSDNCRPTKGFAASTEGRFRPTGESMV